MIQRLNELFRRRPIAAELVRESRALLLERSRIGILLALTFIPVFIPLDYLRMPDEVSFVGSLALRLFGCAFLIVIYAVSLSERIQAWAEWLVALTVAVLAVTVLGIARFSHGANDPIYLVQSMAIVFEITGLALLLPVDGRLAILLGGVVFGIQVLMTLDYAFLENLPILVSTVTALAVATIGAQISFLARLGEYEGRRAKEALLEARAEIVAMLVQDVEAQKRGEDVLRKSERKYRSLFEEYRDGLLLSSPDGRILDANPAALELFGYTSKQELLALRTYDLYWARPELGRDRLTRLLSSDFSLRDIELDCKRKDGEKLNLLVDMTPVRDETGEVAGYRSILRDVTEKKLLEARLRQTQKLEAVGMLAAGVAHEINNPLTYVIAHLDTMAEDLGSPPKPLDAVLVESIRSRIQEASEGAERVRRIVRDLKSFARLGDEERVPVDVGLMLGKAVKLASPQIRYRATLRLDLASVPPVLGNEGRLAQVFLNLLINAAQAIPEGAAERNEICVSAWATEDEVLLEVSDTGEGIRPEHLERLFDPFFTTKSAIEGSGLGLSICYNIVTAHGGRIEVQSDVGLGSRFVVHLPIASALRPSPPAPPPPAAAERRGRVLVVDDEPFVLSTTKIILGRSHDVVGAENGDDALDILDRDDHFDVILCDLMMDRSSGMDMYARLRERNPQLARRMVFMTGGAFTEQARLFVSKISNPCIDKPFSAADLHEAVANVMSGNGAGAVPAAGAPNSDRLGRGA